MARGNRDDHGVTDAGCVVLSVGTPAVGASITVAFFRSNVLSELRLDEPVAKVTMR